MAKRLLFSHSERTVDTNTGEIISEKSVKAHSIKQKEDHFIMLYVEGNRKVLNALTYHHTDMRLLFMLLELSVYNTGVVSISSARREAICEELQINKANFAKNIKRMMDLGIIHGAKGEYILNPAIAWKGDKATRRALLEAKQQATIKPKMISMME